MNDAKRGQVYTKIGREITVAAQQGGADPAGNFRLEQALAKARAANVPKDTIQRAIQRGGGEGAGADGSLEELVYEGYAPGGVGLIVEVVTDNRNRTVSDVRNTLAKLGGTFAEAGAVAWQFESRGEIEIACDDRDVEELELLAIDQGAVDVDQADGSIHVYTAPQDLDRIRRALDEHGCEIRIAELTRLPSAPTELADDEAERVLRLVEELEELEDVRRVHATMELSEGLVAKLAG